MVELGAGHSDLSDPRAVCFFYCHLYGVRNAPPHMAGSNTCVCFRRFSSTLLLLLVPN
eukprot:SAG11_NODE_2298_length_3552_cov_11.614538_4_plen_58_part_00